MLYVRGMKEAHWASTFFEAQLIHKYSLPIVNTKTTKTKCTRFTLQNRILQCYRFIPSE